jgi:hypothetical protein
MGEIKQLIEGYVRPILENKGLQNFSDIDISTHEDPMAFGAAISVENRQIHITVHDKLEELVTSTIRENQLDITEDRFHKRTFNFLVTHEWGHHHYCPRTKENFEAMLEAVYTEIAGEEFREEEIVQTCLYIHNLFSDTTLNTINAYEDEGYKEGFDFAYLLMGHGTKKLMKMPFGFGKRGDKAFTLFWNSGHFLLQSGPEHHKQMAKYLKRAFPGYPRYLRRTLDIFTGNSETTKLLLSRSLDQEHQAQMLERIQDETLWPVMIKEYARIIYPLISQRTRAVDSQYARGKSVSNQKRYQKKCRRSQGSRSSEKPKPEEGKGADQGSRANQKENGEKRGSGSRTEKDKKEGEDGDGKNPSPSKFNDVKELIRRLMEGDYQYIPHSAKYASQFRHWDRLYKDRAGMLRLIAQEEDPMQEQYDLHLADENMPLEEFTQNQVKWSKTRVIETPGGKDVMLQRGSCPIHLPFQHEARSGSIPDLGFIFDSSFSMGFNPEKGEGEYHLAMLAFYSVLNYLEDIGMAPFLNYLGINFSFTTYCSGWKPYYELDEVKRTLFDYQKGGTFLAPEALRDLRLKRQDNALVFMLSDTALNSPANEQEVIREFETMLKEGGIGLYMFVLGGPTTMSKRCQELGASINYIQGVEDFMNATMVVSKELYGEIAENAPA